MHQDHQSPSIHNLSFASLAADLLVIVGAVAGSDDGHVLLGIGESGQLLLQGSLAVCLALPQS